jgi:nucleoside-diphosphate-sugar epimerase
MVTLRVLITGINGNIGTILHEAFKNTYDVYGVDQEGEFSEQVLSANIANYPEIAEAIQKLSPIHAINPKVNASWEDVLHANIVGTRNVFEAAREFQVRRVIFASSNHVTGAYEGFAEDLHLHKQHEPRKISVEDPIRPDSDYGVSKAFGEAVARYYCARWGIEAICLRIGVVLPNDDPTRNLHNRKIWLSHRDLVQLVEKSLISNVVFGIYYGVSNNRGAFWDISNARMELGYQPVDDGTIL